MLQRNKKKPTREEPAFFIEIRSKDTAYFSALFLDS